ncbi:cupin domain-containing protein [Azospirillum humicireducens]|uniref:Cupin domain-containing protein n=1 Tax=Azospirillum humicireducens TaxID=1226968 RepID=A0A160JFA7_9PROT|nr:cupin domain-containing protein [Azospirillum humicireducens]ANC91540.1 cupin domain-containing protein [Azospirillum humicireducens]
MINLIAETATLPHAWRSRIVGKIAGANLKIIRMDEAGIPSESHADFDEALFVLDGSMTLDVEGELIAMSAGDFFVIPAGKSHRVLEGSRGLLFLVDAE